MIWMIFLSLIYRNKVVLPFSQKKKKKLEIITIFFFGGTNTHRGKRERDSNINAHHNSI